MSPGSFVRRRWFLFLGLAVLAGVLAVVLFPRSGTEPPPPSMPAPQQPGPPLPAPKGLSKGSASLADVTAEVVPSVVSIVSTVAPPPGRLLHPFLGPRGRRGPGGPGPVPHGVGSGVIVSEEGLVLTNHHVVKKARSIQVTLSDDREVDAEVLGADPPSDLAVIRLKDPPEDLRPLPFGDSGRLRLGDVVLAVGNPFGVGQAVTMGIVSATGRANVGIVDYEDFIQTDAAINPGNSGGALVDTEGRLVGINTAILSRSGGHQGIGFAIPSNMAKAVMDSLVEHGRVARGWLGVAIQDVDPRLAKALDLGTTEGVVVADVVPGGPADEAGMRRGDVILSLDGDSVTSAGHLRNEVALKGAGAEMALEVLRGDERQRLGVTLGEAPQEGGAPAAPGGSPSPPSLEGLTVAPLDQRARARFGIPDSVRTGVVVAEVEQGSPAMEAGIREGDVIVEVDRKPVSSVEDFTRRLGHARGQVLLRIQRGSVAFFAVLDR
ncbi:MAG: Do family serine endopeptidase [Myxococcota bacterium]